MKNFCSVVALILLFSAGAQAGFLIEPYVGYEMGTYSAQTKGSSSTSDGKTSGLHAGAKLGYVFPSHLLLALDADMGSGLTYKSDTAGGDGKESRSDVYLDVGYVASMFKIYLGYGLMSTSTFTADTGGSESKVKGGTHLKVGLGYEFLNHVGVFAEYFSHKPADWESGSSTGTIDGTYSSYSDTGFVIGASFPFEMGGKTK